MKEVYDLLLKAPVRFLAVCESSQPHLYPFGAVFLHHDRICFCTGRADPVTRQLCLNPRLELCAPLSDGRLNVEGSAVLDNDRASRTALSVPDDAELWYLRNCTATRYFLSEAPKTLRFG